MLLVISDCQKLYNRNEITIPTLFLLQTVALEARNMYKKHFVMRFCMTIS